MIMYKALICKAGAVALGALVLAVYPASDGVAAERLGKAALVRTIGSAAPTNAHYYRPRATHARRFARRRVGFYSYSYRDVINTYGMSRSLYGGINTYRDPFVDRQTRSGPFDHGFFFDSGIAPRGGDSPYIR
jgi:hypothetical protein